MLRSCNVKLSIQGPKGEKKSLNDTIIYMYQTFLYLTAFKVLL